MPKFQYIARTVDQTEQSGSVEAADPQVARRQLEGQGLRVLRLAPANASDVGARLPALSNSDALELTSQIAELAKAGLPLAAGLRAMQAELPRGRFSRAVELLAERVEAGTPADAALSAAASRLPAHVRGMLAAGVHSGRLAEVLQECLEYERLQVDLRRRVWSAIAYPLIVLTLTLVWLIFVLGVLVRPMAWIYRGFNDNVPHNVQVLLWLAGPGTRIAMILGTVAALGLVLAWWFRRTVVVAWLIAQLPLMGPLWRAGNLAAFCRLLATMLEQSIPLPAALRLTAEGLKDGELKAACRESAVRIVDGQSLSQCLISLRAFPQTLALIVRWGERVSAPSEALRSAADLFSNRVELRVDLLGAIVPPIVFLGVATTILCVVHALFTQFYSSFYVLF